MKFKDTVLLTDPNNIKGKPEKIMTNPLIYEDNACTVLIINDNTDPEEVIEKMVEFITECETLFNERGGFEMSGKKTKEFNDDCDKRFDSLGLQVTEFGDFYSDSGNVSVCLKSDVNLKKDEFITIPDFEGSVTCYTDKLGRKHYIGKSSTNFITI